MEIERKFLVKEDLWEPQGESVEIHQGYLSTDPARTVRIRIMNNDAFITIKGKTKSISREEFEYSIPKKDALQMLPLCHDYVIHKIRYKVPYKGKTWEVDIFKDENEGLMMAEIELESEDEKFELPEWVGQEVSGEKRYYNSFLAINSFLSW